MLVILGYYSGDSSVTLDNKQFTRDSVFGPFHVHRAAIVLFDGASPAGQLEDLCVVKHENGLFCL